jgi:hypothetical protein
MKKKATAKQLAALKKGREVLKKKRATKAAKSKTAKSKKRK